MIALVRNQPSSSELAFRQNMPQLLVCDSKGKVYSLPNLESACMKGGQFFRMAKTELIKLSCGSQLFMLPHRVPVGFDPLNNNFVTLENYFAVAAFVSPGHTITYNSAFKEIGRPKMLPLFAYSAACFYRGEFYAAAVRTDRELRQDLRFIKIGSVNKGAKNLKKIFPKNRLIRHLEICALTNHCPAAKNFFLSRYEAPLPTSPYCNASCIGCISYQPQNKCPVTQPRIKFVPSPQEVAETALFHLKNVNDPVVSFGQGCEGEPLLVGKTLQESIKLIRKNTSKGIINLNTNASKPRLLAKLFDAGLDSIRVSLNSAQEIYYNRYYKPQSYEFRDVLESIRIAKRKKKFVSVNYLSQPGFTDSKKEFKSFRKFLNRHHIDMIQWRNMNFDPIRYFREIKFSANETEMLGMREIIISLKKEFPGLMMGYFNPSKLRIKRHFDKLKQ